MFKPSISDLHFNPALEKVVNTFLKGNYGHILVTGPSHSGVTTTLYALFLDNLKSADQKITVEDPIELKIEEKNVKQIQVNKTIGLTFLTALNAASRQDPESVLISKIEDDEVAYQAQANF